MNAHDPRGSIVRVGAKWAARDLAGNRRRARARRGSGRGGARRPPPGVAVTGRKEEAGSWD